MTAASYDEALARAQLTFNTIPNTPTLIGTIGASKVTLTDALLPWKGKAIYLLAVGGDITILRGTQATMTDGIGVPLAQRVAEPWFVSSAPDANTTLSCIADGAGRTLYVLSDSEAG